MIIMQNIQKKILEIRGENAETSSQHHCWSPNQFSKSFASLSSPEFTDYDTRYAVFLPDLILCCDVGLGQWRCSEINSH